MSKFCIYISDILGNLETNTFKFQISGLMINYNIENEFRVVYDLFIVFNVNLHAKSSYGCEKYSLWFALKQRHLM